MTAAVNDPEVWAGRRRKLLDRLGDGLLILPTAEHQFRNSDVRFQFRPASGFYYLTGFPEPEAVLVVSRKGRAIKSVLFVRPRDRERETWEGRRYGVRGARDQFRVDEAYKVSELGKRLPDLLEGHRRIFHTLGANRAFDERLFRILRSVALKARKSNPPAHPEIVDPRPTLAEQRLVKGPEEIRLLARAAEISAAAHRVAMRVTRPGMTEYQVQAELEATFRREGSPRNGYDSIVAGGPNACILHYTENNRTLRAGELLLIDAGAEFGGYTADITRTFPVSGNFSPSQAAVYREVLAAQQAGLRAAKPGAMWDAPHRACVRRLTRGLVRLGVLKGDVGELVREDEYKPWYMHGSSHWLGMDVHDVGPYKDGDGKSVRLRPGMVMTVEPGLYFSPRDRKVPSELRGIGIRIEDDVLITRSGSRVLSVAAPKAPRDVESECQQTTTGNGR